MVAQSKYYTPEEYIALERAKDRMQVEHFVRQGAGWYVTAFNGPDETLRLDSLDAVLSLSAIYEHVEFPVQEHAP